MTESAIVFNITTATYLCPGCGIRGAGGDAFITVQHKNTLTLDRDSLQPKVLTCNGRPTSIAIGATEEPDRGALPQALARMNPACAPWFVAQDKGVVRPVAASPSALAMLGVLTNVSYVYQQVPNPPVPSGRAPVEVRLSLSVTNNGDRAVSLLGVRVPLAFSPRVLVPTQPVPRWATTWPDQFFIECWGGQVAQASGMRVNNDANACQYTSLVRSTSGIDLVFTGGSLCSQCTLSGFGGNAMFALKHIDYLPLDLPPRTTLIPAGPTTVSLPAGPPVMCGISGYVSTLGASSTSAFSTGRFQRSTCPPKSDFNASVAVAAYPPAPPGFNIETDDTNNWFSFDTESRILLQGLINAASVPVDLREISLSFVFNYRVYGGPTTGWLRRPPSEFGWTCWYASSSSQGGNLCNNTIVKFNAPENAEQVYGTPDDDGAPAEVVIKFTAGTLCSGCTLAGGQGGVFGSIHHLYFMPMPIDGMTLKTVTCTDAATGSAVSYNTPAAQASPPPPLPPPPNPPSPPRPPPFNPPSPPPQAMQMPAWLGGGMLPTASSSGDGAGGIDGSRVAETMSTSSTGPVTGSTGSSCPWWRANQCT